MSDLKPKYKNKVIWCLTLSLLYIIISPIIFNRIYPKPIVKLSFVIIFSDIFIITFLTSVVSLIIYSVSNVFFENNWILSLTILIPFICSNLILIIVFPASDSAYNQTFSNTFLISNNLSLAIIFIFGYLRVK